MAVNVGWWLTVADTGELNGLNLEFSGVEERMISYRELLSGTTDVVIK